MNIENIPNFSQEDFSQLLGFSRETKYDASMEKVISVLEKHCTFPVIEKRRLFRLTIFNFLIGNEDMHLKNFSLINKDNKIEMSPSYDLINTTIILNGKEEIALPIRGKKSNLKRSDLIGYFWMERLELSESVIEEEIALFKQSFSFWDDLIAKSFLSPSYQKKYKKVIEDRRSKIDW